jgi:hypothetical protein
MLFLRLPRVLSRVLIALAFALPIIGAISIARPAYADCQQNTPHDGGTALGYGWDMYITAYMSGNCSGSHYVGYDYYNTANTVIWIDVDSARAWICGSLAANQNPPAAQTNYAYAWSGWAGPTTCGWQADMSTHFWKSGAFDDWAYTNI